VKETLAGVWSVTCSGECDPSSIPCDAETIGQTIMVTVCTCGDVDEVECSAALVERGTSSDSICMSDEECLDNCIEFTATIPETTATLYQCNCI